MHKENKSRVNILELDLFLENMKKFIFQSQK